LPESGDLAAKLSLVYTGTHRLIGQAKMQELSLEHVALCLKEFYEEVRARN